ncbi:adenylyl-sulfate reductase subunit alpha [Heliobacterium chlorum]|uniref:Adenylyl-sulfate reductase subunit alpha n=1 Tax=Heliobacterium chlorum TaxID=2698 RepID=A0ABR7T335_HELCL|nr:adenylyl-sulfate reductase subunit alpha [Heliobacterium chlorum]MBC9784390.1 adenylyl-sulfate reductase subunit alpha [Heliobacterium chlorum]
MDVLDTDWLVLGGGAAGIMAAIRAKELCPTCRVTVIEKANVQRSGCLAAGINAINAYLNPGETAESFLSYVKAEFANLVRDDLVYTLAERLNEMTDRLVEWGLPVFRDEQGRYLRRGRASVQINGEAIKPLMVAALHQSGAEVFNHRVATDLIIINDRVVGALVLNLADGSFTSVRAKGVLIATGGVSGIYGPNAGGAARHKQWYSPFNAGAGWAMAARAGAELTSLEMRFIALRVAHTMAPTGTLAQGVRTPHINRINAHYLNDYTYEQVEPTTAERLWATLQEEKQGRGPCYLDTRGLTPEQGKRLQKAYLSMCPTQVLQWSDAGKRPEEMPVPITGSEPYLVGGHGMAGLWIDERRRTTVTGLYAAGDAAGGAPKKYVTGSMAEGAIAAETFLEEIQDWQEPNPGAWKVAVDRALQRAKEPLLFNVNASQKTDEHSNSIGSAVSRNSLINSKNVATDGKNQIRQLEEQLQAVMDRWAGGRPAGYVYDAEGLLRAQQEVDYLIEAGRELKAGDAYELMRVHEVWDRLLLARLLLAHMLYRKESRWPVYQSRLDYPSRDDQRWRIFVNSRIPVQNVQKKIEIKIIERPPVDSHGTGGQSVLSAFGGGTA